MEGIYSAIYLIFLLLEALVLASSHLYRVWQDPALPKDGLEAETNGSRIYPLNKYWFYTGGSQWFTPVIHICANITCLLWGVSWFEAAVMTLTKRAGIMATANLIPLLLSATRQNPLIWIPVSHGVRFRVFIAGLQ